MLLLNFNLLATAPGGVVRLRELILTLAVQGKLVPQDPGDEPASVLLKKIRAEKDRLITEGKIKREKDEPALTDDDPPFGLPKTWAWVALGEVIDIIRGITFPATQKTREPAPGRIACLRTTNVQQTIEWDDLLFVDRSFMGRENQLIRHHDIVMSMANSRELVGKVALIEHIPHPESTFGGFLGVLRPRKIDPRYAMAVLRTPYARLMLIDSSSQTTNIANVSLTKLRPLPFPLPPPAEQSRIVARVEELMRVCDALEVKGKLETAQHAQLVSTLLGTLIDSDTPEALAENWQRIATHFDPLLDRPQAIDAFEQTILQLAVRGLLVPQDPGDEPASVLLQKIFAKKGRVILEGKIKRDKPLPPVAEDEKPFALPDGWEWTRFPDLCAIRGGATPSKAVSANWIGEIPWVSPKDMKIPLISDAQDHVSDLAVRGSLSLIPSGSLLIVVRGMILAHSFPIAQTQAPVTINQDMKALTSFEPRVLSFLALICEGMKPEILRLIDRSTHGTCKLESAKIFGMLIPLPPLPEQSRIVARVEELRRLCADLRQRLSASQTTQAHLAEVLLESVDNSMTST